MKKKLLIALAVVVLLAIVALVGVYIYIDVLAQRGIERGATYATGVKTTLGSAAVGITTGELTMKELEIANPQGYADDHFLDMERGHVAVGLRSLLEQQIEVPLVELRGLDMSVERVGGRNNYDVILDNIRKLVGEKPREGAKTYVIHRLVIERTTVRITGFGVGAQTLTLPTIELTDIGTGGDAKAMSEVVGIVIRELMQSLLSDPSKLPGLLVGSLSEELAGLGGLGDVGVEMIGQIGEGVGQAIGEVGEKVGDISKEGGKAVEDVQKRVDEGLEGVQEGIGGIGDLFGGDKQQDDQSSE